MTRAAVAEALRRRVDREQAPRRHLRIVDDRELRRLRLGLFGTLMVILVFVTVAALAGMQAFLVQGQLQLDQLDARIDELEEAKTATRLGVARLESPETVIAEAEAMGMLVPDEVIFLQPRPEPGEGLDPLEMDGPSLLAAPVTGLAGDSALRREAGGE